ncbi:ATP-grasp domain-containing protein [Paenibacillus nasutitermitis]|uniref:Carbamoyl phosphate synthase n=1 Tax=Paenibacillus nasutitermitis TaxID=1652958 RepID=A0A917DW58_9BACL|nr:ATP-grasp domain-containing protein [Paenibacillus nasutitermitis]GGD73310.1 carbamoyl phosphate synthase [Paenibacillus nasutitermitis]
MNMNDLNILFTSSGRRVSLIRKFKEAYARHGIQGKVVTADIKPSAPAAFAGDRHALVPRVTDPRYVDALLELCKEERIHLVIPLIDTELVLLAAHKALFEQHQIRLLLSSIELNELASDKLKTFAFFNANGIRTPKVYSEEEIRLKQFVFPLLIKPRRGSSSQGVTIIRNERELDFFKDYIPEAMVQELVSGEEYTVDVMLDFHGAVKAIVPRLRMETRAGEVSKGVTRKDESVIRAVRQVVSALPGPVGCITLQCFKQTSGEITFIEINPRFGGGIPLAIEAGADFPLWTLMLGRGERFSGERDDSWDEDLTMLRYDDAFFTKELSL